MNQLNHKQQKFAYEYLIDLNATQAAIRAGYSPRTAKQIGQRLMKSTKVSSIIEELQSEKCRAIGLKADDVISNLQEIVRRCMQSEPVRDKNGNLTGEYRFNAAGALRGLELLGKHLGLFTDRVEHSGEVSHTINIVNFAKKKCLNSTICR